MNTKYIFLPLAFIAMALSSCYPPYPYQPQPLPGGYPDPAPGSDLTSSEQADIREARDRVRNRETSGDPSPNPGNDPASNPPPRKQYRVAATVPGRPGLVIDPFTNVMIDVKGIPGGTLVTNPGDPENDKDGDGILSEEERKTARKFRLPPEVSAP